jgi:hypothetical protein
VGIAGIPVRLNSFGAHGILKRPGDDTVLWQSLERIYLKRPQKGDLRQIGSALPIRCMAGRIGTAAVTVQRLHLPARKMDSFARVAKTAALIRSHGWLSKPIRIRNIIPTSALRSLLFCL